VRARSVPLAATLALAVVAAAGAAHAHQRSTSYSSWQLDAHGARVVLRVPQLELTRLPWGPAFEREIHPQLATYLVESLRLFAGGEPCAPASPPALLASPPDQASFEWRVACAGAGARGIRTDFLLDVAPSHLHFASARGADGRRRERVLAGGEQSWTIDAGAGGSAATEGGSSFATYFLLGVEHIATGWDHLAFVLALILIAARLGEVATVVTGFTVAHSVTLALAVLGFVRPDARSIESLIGLSIALVAVENLWQLAGRPRSVLWALAGALALAAGAAAAGLGGVGATTLGGVAVFSACYLGLVERLARPARLRVAIAFAFGLVHGFGFAGVLAEMHLPGERLVAALFGFNLGVEAGQLAVVALLWPPLRVLALRARALHRLLVETASATVCALGLFWFTTRAFG
jgi:hypothetical protein